jgi:hypothetical protein
MRLPSPGCLKGTWATVAISSPWRPEVSAALRSCASIQVRAAAIPRPGAVDAESVWRVPKPTSAAMSARIREGDTSRSI